jgi:WD40 repeat protein
VLTACDDGAARVWPADGLGDPVVLRHPRPVRSARFSPDGARIVTTCEDDSARVWRSDGTGEPIVLRHERPVQGARFSPDGTRVVTACRDGSARVWRVEWATLLAYLRTATRRPTVPPNDDA